MDSKPYNLELDLSILSIKSINNNTTPYVVVSFLKDGSSRYEKLTTFNKKKNGNYNNNNNNLHLKDVNMRESAIRFQVFTPRKVFQDKHVANIMVPVTELISSATCDGENHETHATYEFVSSKTKNGSIVLKFSYNLSLDGQDYPKAVPSNVQAKLADAIGHDIGLFKMVPTYRRCALKSLDWA